MKGRRRRMHQRWAKRGFSGVALTRFSGKLTLRYSLIVIGTIAAVCWGYAGRGSASDAGSWQIQEIPVSVRPGDQNGVSVSGDDVVFVDGSEPGGAALTIVDVSDGRVQSMPLTAGVVAGPDSDAGALAWQSGDLMACRAPFSGAAACLALPQAAAMAFSGNLAVTSHDGKVIRLVNFETMRSRILDSSTSSGGRYDPDVDGSQGVWVRERGYAGKYYEPLIVSYDLLTDTLTHVTAMGGGATPEGESVFERRHPTVDGGRIFYQQRQRGPLNQWDINEAVPGSFGQPVVTAPGDQVHPGISADLLVYQDNRGGHPDESGRWVGEWDIYLKDLSSGVEIAVCTSPGDQVNPAIDGDLIVWEDNRNGDWDIYAARLVTSVEQPLLSLSSGPAYWRSYENYAAGILTARYRIENQGSGLATGTALEGVVATPGSVALADALPVAIAASVAPGATAAFELDFHVPPGLSRFRTSLFVRTRDAAGEEIWFPAAPPAG